MNRQQLTALVVGVINLAVIVLFPPFDELPVGKGTVSIFGGFHWYSNNAPYSTVNSPLLYLEMIVVLVNAGVAWLLLAQHGAQRRRFGYRNAVLVGIAVNLVVLLLFPPFEFAYAVTGAALPSFEGFHFIFSPNPGRTVVTTILYLEVFFALINGGLLWLLLKEKSVQEIRAEDVFRRLSEGR